MRRAAEKYATFLIFTALFYHVLVGNVGGRAEPCFAIEIPPKPMFGHETPHVMIRKEPHNPCFMEMVFDQEGPMAGRLVYWNGLPFEGTLSEPLHNGSQYLVHHMLFHGDQIYFTRKDLYQAAPDGGTGYRKLKTWYYYFDKDRDNTLRQIDIYRPQSGLIQERRLFDENERLTQVALFEYGPLHAIGQAGDSDYSATALKRMHLRNAQGMVTQDYEELVEIDLKKRLRTAGLPESEIQRRLAVAMDTSRTPVLIFDSGIDIGHLDLAHKMWKNPHERLDGIDDDGNGLVDDLYGVSDNPQLKHPVEDLRLPRFGLPKFSHGTLVASVATRDRDDVAIMAVSEITAINSQDIFDKAEKFIKAHKVRFTNMSFVFDKLMMDFGATFERAHRLKKLIAHTPETLHVMASGNGTDMAAGGVDIDRCRKPEDLVPAMLDFHNTLVVGALATHELSLADYPRYRLADFSNVGETSVDILAPGYQVRGARLGGGDMVADGTSFAAPYVFNHGVMNIVKANPQLDIYEIKEILLKTAYIPNLDSPFPVRSGGILHPKRATAVAQYLKQFPHSSVEEAVLAVRRQEKVSIPGEANDDGYLHALQQFWARRGVGNALRWVAENTHQQLVIQR